MGINMARRRLLVTLEIPSKDKAHHWVLNWISSQSKNAQHLSVATQYRRHDNGSATTFFDFVPSLGNHYFRYRNRWIQVHRHRETNMLDLNSGTPWETVTLTSFGRDKEWLVDLLQEAKEMAMAKEEGKTVIYTGWGTEWRPFGPPRRRRPLNSVILDDGVAEKIAADVQDFLQSPAWYIDRGIPYRRGYLLYGPPGCGKSSFIQALAGELQYDICILNLAERGMTDDKLNHLLSVAPKRSFVLLEDVDAVFHKREIRSSDGYNLTVTFSGLLNALDGVASGEERIVFMTTNYLDRLDSALIRPGRVDIKQEIREATESQIKRMFLRFHPDSDALAATFAARLSGCRVTMAQLQGYFMLHKADAQDAAACAEELLTPQAQPTPLQPSGSQDTHTLQV
eukprot:GILJ01009163.1.p1 GENE.GILJ01009163.1~~GILJ01009163.1.p1  ORF type:complete len:421 (+),score=67.47 GILJ01009163.1:74-1264(+)